MRERAVRPTTGLLRAVTYNVHRCVGLDGRESVGRIAALLESLSPDVIALQELLHDESRRPSQAAALASRLGMHLVFGEAMREGGASYGVALLLRRAPERVATHRLPRLPPAEPRVALEAAVGGLTVVTTHLGLSREERAVQAGRLMQRLPRGGPLLMLGDFNCDRRSPPVQRLARALHLEPMPPGRLRTFPSPFPVFELDYALGRGLSLVSVRTLRGRLARVASDHLPVLVEIIV